MPKLLPPRPNLEQLRKQAKDLLKSLKSGDPEAIKRIQENHPRWRSEEHTSELQSQSNLVCRLLLEKKNAPPSSHDGKICQHLAIESYSLRSATMLDNSLAPRLDQPACPLSPLNTNVVNNPRPIPQ